MRSKKRKAPHNSGRHMCVPVVGLDAGTLVPKLGVGLAIGTMLNETVCISLSLTHILAKNAIRGDGRRRRSAFQPICMTL